MTLIHAFRFQILCLLTVHLQGLSTAKLILTETLGSLVNSE